MQRLRARSTNVPRNLTLGTYLDKGSFRPNPGRLTQSFDFVKAAFAEQWLFDLSWAGN